MSDQAIENKLRDELMTLIDESFLSERAMFERGLRTDIVIKEGAKLLLASSIALSLDRIASAQERIADAMQYSLGNRAMTAEEAREMFGFDPLECGQEYDAERASVDESDKQVA